MLHNVRLSVIDDALKADIKALLRETIKKARILERQHGARTQSSEKMARAQKRVDN